MSFDAFETADGRPVEFLTFVNGSQVWRYTNANRPVMPAGQEFQPLAYKRTEAVYSQDSDDAQVRVTVPGNLPVVALYDRILTSHRTSLSIERYHDNDPAGELVVEWKGVVASALRNDAKATFLVKPITQTGHTIPAETFQGSCNWFLYESGTCKLSRDDFRFVATVTSVTNETVVTVSGLRVQAAALDAGVSGSLTSGELDEYWLGGYCEANGEVRRIAEAPVASDPDAVRVSHPFRQLEAGDAIIVYAGCRRDVGICDRKFANTENFGGWPTVPEVNPFRTELPPGGRRTSGGFFGGFSSPG